MSRCFLRGGQAAPEGLLAGWPPVHGPAGYAGCLLNRSTTLWGAVTDERG